MNVKYDCVKAALDKQKASLESYLTAGVKGLEMFEGANSCGIT